MEVSTQPYWQHGGSLVTLPLRPLPPRVDVVVVGAGYTGLSAAHETLLAGARTLVLEAGAVGAGCSGRNGGQVAYSIKPTFDSLKARYGERKAFAICHEGRAALEHLRSLATVEKLDCDWREQGCYFGASTPRHFAAMVRELQRQPPGLEQRITVVTKAETAAHAPTLSRALARLSTQPPLAQRSCVLTSTRANPLRP